MLAGKRKRTLSLLLSLLMVLSIGIPSGVYGNDSQSHIHVHGEAGFCSDGYYYTGKCTPPAIQTQEVSADVPETQGEAHQPGNVTKSAVDQSEKKTQSGHVTEPQQGDEHQPGNDDPSEQASDGKQPVGHQPERASDEKQPAGHQPEQTSDEKQPAGHQTEQQNSVKSSAAGGPEQTGSGKQSATDEIGGEATDGVTVQTEESTTALTEESAAKPSGIVASPVGVSVTSQDDKKQLNDVKTEGQGTVSSGGKETTETAVPTAETDSQDGWQCERYPYFTVTFADQHEKNKQTFVRVVPALPEQFPLTAPDFQNKEGKDVAYWTDKDGNPVELDSINADKTVYANWEPPAANLLNTVIVNPCHLQTEYQWYLDPNISANKVQVYYYKDKKMVKWKSGEKISLPRQAFPLFFVKVEPGYEVKTTDGLELRDMDELEENGFLIGSSFTGSKQYAGDLLKGSIRLYTTAKGKLLSDWAFSLPALISGKLDHYYSLDGTTENEIDTKCLQLSDYQKFFCWSPWLYTSDAKDRTIHLTAEKKPDSTLTYNANGGELGRCPQSIKERTDIPATLTFDGITRQGYQFLGWSEDPNASKPEYTQDGNNTILMDKDKTLYAVWNKEPAKSGVDAQFFIRLDGRVPLENGSKQYAHGDYTTGKLTGKIDGEACWTKYEGVIDKSGRIDGKKVEEAFASVQSHIITPPSADAIKEMLKKDQGAKNHKLTFDPEKQRVIWYVVKRVPSEGNAWHVDGVICDKDADKMLQYHGNALGDQTVKGIPDMKLYVENQDAPIVYDGIHRKGYQFCGWSENPNATPEDLEYPVGGKRTTIHMDGEKHLYAVWKANPPVPEGTYAVHYDANVPDDVTVQGMPKDEEKLKKGEHELSEEYPTRPDETSCTWECKGWSLEPNGDPKEDRITQVAIEDRNVTVYAIWEKHDKTYTVIYDANVPSGAILKDKAPDSETNLSKTELETKPHTLSQTKPSLQDESAGSWEFKGWSLEQNPGQQKSITKITKDDVTGSSVTVYAIWESTPKKPDDPSGGGSDPSGGGGQGGGNTDPSGSGSHDRDHSGSDTVIIPETEVPLASQPFNPPEVTIPDQPIPLASNPEEQAEPAGIPLEGVTKLPKTGGIGAGLVIGAGALLIALGLLLRRKERRSDRTQ